jgi:hypothetical protein
MVVRNGIPILFKDSSTMNHAMKTTQYGDLYFVDNTKQYRTLCKRLGLAKFYYIKKKLPDGQNYKVRVLPDKIFTMKL